eukprot:5250110-Pleurochrysis_carterae.AAC.1
MASIARAASSMRRRWPRGIAPHCAQGGWGRLLILVVRSVRAGVSCVSVAPDTQSSSSMHTGSASGTPPDGGGPGWGSIPCSRSGTA